MIKTLATLWARLSEDLLIFRVMFFNLGVFIAALPVIAFATGTALEVNDGSFYILLGLLFAGGTYLLYVASLGTDRQLSNVGAGVALGEIWAILALVTLSVPITLAIKWWRSHRV